MMEFGIEATQSEQRFWGTAVNLRRMTSWLWASTILCSASVGLSYPSFAQQPSSVTAQSRAVQFSIPAQPLPAAIDAFIRRTGWQVGYSTRITDGLRSAAVAGTMPPAQALRTLLAGTGINVRLTGANTATLVTPNVAGGAVSVPGAIPLDTIDVQGAGNPNSTMTPMPAYAGGQVATGGQVGMLGNRSVMNTPFSQTNYTNKTINDQQARTVIDVLANEPSMITNSRGGGHVDMAYFRGFATQSVGGTRSLNGLTGIAPMAFPTTDFIERVEVLRGPSALLGGAFDTLGGTVNLVTKRAGDEPLTELTTRYMSNSQFGAHVDIGRRFGINNEFGIRFNGALDGGDTPVDTQSTKSRNAALNLDYRGERVRLSIDLAHQRQDFDQPHNSLELYNMPGVLDTLTKIPKAPRNSIPLGPSWGRSTSEATVGMVQGEVDISDSVTAYGAIGAQRLDSSFNRNGLYLLDETGAAALGSGATRQRYDMLSMQSGVRAKASTGPIDHTLNLNLSRTQWTYNFRYADSGDGFTPVGSIYNPVFPAYGGVSVAAPTKTNVTDSSSIAIADTMSMLNERIQFTAGIRYKKVSVDSIWSDPYASAAWTPAFGLVVKPWENVSLYANYIQDLQPGTTVSSYYANAGQSFAPYLSSQYEAGVKVDWGRVTTTLAVFQIAQPIAIAISDPAGGLPTLALNGEQRNRGVELNAYGELFDGVRVLGGVTLLDSRQMKTENGTFDGQRGAGAPAFRAVIGGEWDTPFVKGLTLTGRLTYTGDVPVANTRPDLTVPAWTQVDLGARYAFDSPWNGKPIIVRFNVDNVFDQSYWKAAHDMGVLYRSDPRTYRLSTTIKF